MPDQEPKFLGIPVYRLNPNVSYPSCKERVYFGSRNCWANWFYTLLAAFICYLPLEAYFILKYWFRIEILQGNFSSLNIWIQFMILPQFLLHVIRSAVWGVVWDDGTPCYR